MIDKIIEILFPPLCIGCKKEGGYICDKCSLFISEARLACPECHKFNYNGRTHDSCKKSPSLEGLVSFWDHEFLIKLLVSKAKDDGCFDIFRKLVQESFQIMSSDKRYYHFLDFLMSSDLIAYVPINRKEKRKKGFDPNEIIAKEIGRISGIKVGEILFKKDDNIISEKINFYNVVLVDDHWFAESSMINCVKVLKQSGAHRVYGYTISKIA